MMNVDASIVINRPLAEVFAFVANFENQPKWAMNFLEAKQTSAGPIGVGTTFRCVMKVPGQKAVSQLVITEFEPNRKIAFRGDQPAQAKPVGSMMFESVEGGTKVSSLPRPEMGGIFKLLEPLMAGMIRKSNIAHLENLKRLLESAAA